MLLLVTVTGNSARKRLAFVLTQDGGGPVDVTVGLARWFADQEDYEVRLFAPRPRRDAERVHDLLVDLRVDGKAAIRDIRAARRRILAWKPDIVHAQDRRSGLVCAGLGGLRHQPAVVHTYHGVPDDVSQEWLLGRGGRSPSAYTMATLAGDAAVARTVDHTVVVAAMMKDFLRYRLHAPNDRVSHISNGLWLPIARPPARVRRFTFVGALIERKGVSDLIEAAALARRQVPDLHIDIIGDGPERLSLERQVEMLKLGQSVSFLGFRSDVLQQLARTDAFVLPSRMEQQPLVLIEAMASGKLVVATDSGGVRQMLDPVPAGSRLVPPRSPQQLAAALVDLARHSDPAAAGAAMASEAISAYSIDVCGLAHRSLYDRLLSNSLTTTPSQTAARDTP